MGKKKNTNSSMVTLYAELNKTIPAQKNALEVLEQYQKQMGLSRKDALVFILIAFGKQKGKTDFLQLPTDSFSCEEISSIDNDTGIGKQDRFTERRPAKEEVKKNRQEEKFLSPDMESFLDENMEDFL